MDYDYKNETMIETGARLASAQLAKAERREKKKKLFDAYRGVKLNLDEDYFLNIFPQHPANKYEPSQQKFELCRTWNNECVGEGVMTGGHHGTEGYELGSVTLTGQTGDGKIFKGFVEVPKNCWRMTYVRELINNWDHWEVRNTHMGHEQD